MQQAIEKLDWNMKNYKHNHQKPNNVLYMYEIDELN